MVIVNGNDKVFSYEATKSGMMSTSVSELRSSTSYVMTMKFGDVSGDFYTTNIMVRAYAQLDDGTYIYSDVEDYVIYDIADILYQNQWMNTESGHNYLYDKILNKISSSYIDIAFDTNLSLYKDE